MLQPFYDNKVLCKEQIENKPIVRIPLQWPPFSSNCDNILQLNWHSFTIETTLLECWFPSYILPTYNHYVELHLNIKVPRPRKETWNDIIQLDTT